MQLLISVIVPVYKTEKYLHRCIDSILAQSFTNFELILVNDGSPDNSGAICDEYAKKDERVKVFHKVNEGAGLARKYGVEKAESEWIVFVDSDDTIPEKALENLINDSYKGKYDLVVGTFIDNKGYIYKHNIFGDICRERYIEALLADATMIGPVVKLYKKKIFNKCRWNTDKRIIQNEDLLMLIDYTVHVDRVYISNENICYKQYVREDSVSQSIKMSSDGWLLLFDRLDEIIDSINIDNLKILLYKYKLRRISVRVLGYALKLDMSSNTIKRILRDGYMYGNHLTNVEQDTLYMLKSKFRRNKHYLKLKTKATIKAIMIKLGLFHIYKEIRK